ncbi:hypothetical protein [Alicyclobacillus fructus]|uniref:type IV pilus modification PilV family protein n=1 Tax=Alicyclobacillus fructus TaxID=2816082 RepID=UPI001A8F19EA|nr:hypothetical protein [Alicyclobacillus fructus]
MTLWLRKKRNRPESQSRAFTLIEVLASVVIVVMAGTAALFAVESVQAGQLKEAEYSKSLGLATTIAEEIRDRDPNAQINVYAPIAQTSSLSTSGGSVIATLFSSLQIFQSAVSIVFASLLNTILQTGAWGNLDLQNLVENLINQPTSQWGTQIQQWMQQGQMTTIQQNILQNQQALLPFEIVVPGDALGDNPPAQDAVLYVPSPVSLSSESSPGSINGSMTYTEFVLALARGGKTWNQPYKLMDGYTCTVNAQRVSSSSGSSPSVWNYTVTVQSPHGATAAVTVPVVA